MDKTILAPFLSRELTEEEKEKIAQHRPALTIEESCRCETKCNDPTCIFCSEIQPT